MLDVEFEYFDVEEIDFHGIKLLLKQLFDADKDLFDISALSDLIISQPFLGSTVKVADDEHAAKENDPFAFFSVLNLHAHTVSTSSAPCSSCKLTERRQSLESNR